MGDLVPLSPPDTEVERIERDDHHLAMIQKINQDYALVHLEGTVVVIRLIDDTIYSLANATSAFATDYGTYARSQKLSPREMLKVWEGHPAAKTYKAGLTMQPNNSNRDIVCDETGFLKLNIWREWGVTPREGSIDPFMRFLEEIIPEKRSREYFLDWLAKMFQDTLDRPDTAIILVGNQGTGKSTLGEMVGSLVGKQHTTQENSGDRLLGKFGGYLDQKVFVHVDEYFPQQPKELRKMRNLITSKELTTERKGINPFQIVNSMWFLFTINHHTLGKGDSDERRFAVIDVSDAWRNDTNKFEALWDLWKAGGAGHVLYYLLHRQVTTNLRVPPLTHGLLKLRGRETDSVFKWLESCLASGVVLSDRPFGGPYTADELFSAYRESLSGKSAGVDGSDQLAKAVRRYIKVDTRLRGTKNKRQRKLFFPELKEARQQFIRSSGCTPNWGNFTSSAEGSDED